MENPNLENWNEVRYKELNTYFRIKIEHMLRTNMQLKDQLNQTGNMQLKDLVAHMEITQQTTKQSKCRSGKTVNFINALTDRTHGESYQNLDSYRHVTYLEFCGNCDNSSDDSA